MICAFLFSFIYQFDFPVIEGIIDMKSKRRMLVFLNRFPKDAI
jgi:hypothetical protein